MLHIAVFASGRGSNLEALYQSLISKPTAARIVLVVSNNSDAGALTFARSVGIPALHLSRQQFSSDDGFVEAVKHALVASGVNFIVLAGYMKKMDPRIIREYHHRILNIHPALLPRFGGKGMYGHHVHEAVLAAGEKHSGATVHLVDEEYDHGLIILQRTVEISINDTPVTLAAKVLKIEHQILPEAVRLFANQGIVIQNGHAKILTI